MSAAAYRELIADAYRSASLSGAPMLLAAPLFEAVREALELAPEPDTAELAADVARRGVVAQDLLERQIAASDVPGLTDALVRLRLRLREVLLQNERTRIRAGFVRGADAGWQVWLHAFGTALGAFEIRRCCELADELPRLREELPAAAEPPEDVVAMSRATPDLFDEEWDKTEDVFLRVGRCVAVDPRDRCKALVSAAQVQIYYGNDLEAAQRHLDAARALSNDGRVMRVQGDLRLKQSRRDEARTCFEEAIRISPELADGYVAIAELLLGDPASPDLDSAEQWARQALQRVGGVRAYETLIEIGVKRTGVPDQESRVEDLLRRAIRADPDGRIRLLFLVGRSYSNVRNHQLALRYFDQILDGAPSRPWNYHLWRGMLRNDLERYDDAQVDLLAALSGTGLVVDDARRALERMAVALAKKGRAVAPGRAVLDEIRGVLGDKYESGYQAQLQDLQEEASLAINTSANEAFSAGNYPVSIDLYRQAIELFPDPVYCSNLVGAWENVDGVPPAEALEHAIEAMRRAVALAPENGEYRLRLEGLERQGSLIARFPIPLSRLPVVTPIAVEVGSDIGKVIEGEGGAGLAPLPTLLFASMRDTVFQKLGVRVPGVRVRLNESDLSGETYILMLSEVPIVSGDISLERMWAMAPPTQVEHLGAGADAVPHPSTGAETSWIAAADRDKVAAAGVAVLSPLEYLVAHLQAVVEHNLPDFLGLQEVANLLEGAHLLAPVSARTGALAAFTAALRALVAERVPITELAALWEAFAAASERGLGVVDTVEELRRLPKIREQLAGNRSAAPRYIVGDDFIAALRASIHHEDAVPVLAMEPSICQDALSAVRTALAGTSQATLVCSGDVRPFLKSLVALEFPDLAVTCADELTTPADASLPRIDLS